MRRCRVNGNTEGKVDNDQHASSAEQYPYELRHYFPFPFFLAWRRPLISCGHMRTGISRVWRGGTPPVVTRCPHLVQRYSLNFGSNAMVLPCWGQVIFRCLLSTIGHTIAAEYIHV